MNAYRALSIGLSERLPLDPYERVGFQVALIGTSAYASVSAAAVVEQARTTVGLADMLALDEYACLALGYASFLGFWSAHTLDSIVSYEDAIAARFARTPALAIFPAAACQVALVLRDTSHASVEAKWTLQGRILPHGVDFDDPALALTSTGYFGMTVRLAQLVLLALYHRPMHELCLLARPLCA